MRFVEPKVIHLAGTELDRGGVGEYLKAAGADGWKSDAGDGGSELVEIAGKLCYRSFSEDLNPNLRRVRTGDNQGYVGNLLRQGHGSVLEHVVDSYVLVGVTRVLTHEFVRHRMCSFSQESLRFVRLTDLEAYWPDALEGSGVRDLMRNTFEYLEDIQLHMANRLDLDGLKDFDAKKRATSAMRRMAPIGLATTILITANMRSWRHIIASRTAPGAEEEIRKAAHSIYRDLKARRPALLQDATVEVEGGLPCVRLAHGAV